MLPTNQAQGTSNECLQENGKRWTNRRSSDFDFNRSETDAIFSEARTHNTGCMGVANYLCHSEHVHNIVNKMASYHDRAAEYAQKSLLTLLEAETKPLITALIRIQCGGFI